mgnify:CR=1 FL=1|jgi:hypothetical protein
MSPKQPLVINKQTPEEILLETKILEIQEKWKVKVVKHGLVYKRKGLLFKSYKEFECFMLETGVILFYTQTP